MIMVSKGLLKAKMLVYFRRVEQTGETLVVTNHGRPVLRVEPIRERKPLADAFADASGQLRVAEEDLLQPETDEWDDV